MGRNILLAGIATSTTPFQYPVGSPAPPVQYTFLKAVQFSPIGEAQVNNNNNSPQTVRRLRWNRRTQQLFLVPTPANVVAVQFTGLGGNVKIYRR